MRGLINCPFCDKHISTRKTGSRYAPIEAANNDNKLYIQQLGYGCGGCGIWRMVDAVDNNPHSDASREKARLAWNTRTCRGDKTELPEQIEDEVTRLRAIAKTAESQREKVDAKTVELQVALEDKYYYIAYTANDAADRLELLI